MDVLGSQPPPRKGHLRQCWYHTLEALASLCRITPRSQLHLISPCGGGVATIHVRPLNMPFLWVKGVVKWSEIFCNIVIWSFPGLCFTLPPPWIRDIAFWPTNPGLESYMVGYKTQGRKGFFQDIPYCSCFSVLPIVLFNNICMYYCCTMQWYSRALIITPCLITQPCYSHQLCLG